MDENQFGGGPRIVFGDITNNHTGVMNGKIIVFITIDPLVYICICEMNWSSLFGFAKIKSQEKLVMKIDKREIENNVNTVQGNKFRKIWVIVR